ncbi:Mu-like prophage major head subunit gpT family protein [Ralstonia solanacearum]|uniref:Mu-like prophage major head subunit gpT family protein n=1 Tax=Ralstonia solanacearum TaxID=305 RepID=UPI001E4F0A49|nr:Mu-like prophage major head subunit gpT family protein [Ralstonia solanacearum]
MGAITQAQLDALKTTLIARWNAGLVATPEDWKKIAKLVTSSSKSNTYEWLSQFPAFREWIGSRLHKKFKENGYNVPNRKFECTVDVQRTDIEDDTIGQYGAIAESAGQSASDLKNDLVFQALAAGFSSPCYDGQYFFDLDHPVYANEDGTGAVTNVSNMQDGTGAPWVLLCTKRAASPIYLQQRVAAEFDSITSTTNQNVFDLDVYSFGGRWRGEAAYGFWQCAFGSKAPITADNFNAAYAAMMNFKGDGQRKLGIVPDTLACGPDNMADAEKLLKALQNANGSSNTNYNKVELIVTPWM